MSAVPLSVLNLNIGSADIPSVELDVKVSFSDTDPQIMDASSVPNGISTTESTPQTNGSAPSMIPPVVDEDVRSVEDDDDDDDIRIHLSMDQKTRLVKQPVSRPPQSVAVLRTQPATAPIPTSSAPAGVVASSASSTATSAPATLTRTNSTSSSAAGGPPIVSSAAPGVSSVSVATTSPKNAAAPALRPISVFPAPKPGQSVLRPPTALSAAPPASKPPGTVDLDAAGDINGHPTVEFPIESLEDKDRPWNRPGADITDYFNYGFSELSWRQYVNKQRDLRKLYGGQQKRFDPQNRRPMGPPPNSAQMASREQQQTSMEALPAMGGMSAPGGGPSPAMGASGVGRIGQAHHGVFSGAGPMPMGTGAMHLATGPPLISGLSMHPMPSAIPPMLLNMAATQNLQFIGLTPTGLPIHLGGSPTLPNTALPPPGIGGPQMGSSSASQTAAAILSLQRQATLFDTNLPPPLMGPGGPVAVSVSGGPAVVSGGGVVYQASAAAAVAARAPSPTEAAAAAILQQQASDNDAFKSALAGFTLREVKLENHSSSSSRHAHHSRSRSKSPSSRDRSRSPTRSSRDHSRKHRH